MMYIVIRFVLLHHHHHLLLIIIVIIIADVCFMNVYISKVE
jgi:hypothetical protein